MAHGKADMDDVKELTNLGSNETNYKYDKPCVEMLETFPNKFAPGSGDQGYLIDMNFPEFTSLCPKTGQPDFARIRLQYIPNENCLESKSLKLYFFAFRSFGAFMESITNKMLRDFVEASKPRWMQVSADFAPRGALAITVHATYDDLRGFVTEVLRAENA